MNLIEHIQGVSPFLTKRYSYVTDIIERILERFKYNKVILSNLEYSRDVKNELTLPETNNKRNIVLQTDLINNFNKLIKYYRLCVGNRTAKLYTTGINFGYNYNYKQSNIIDIEYFNSDSIMSIIELIDVAYTIKQLLPVECNPCLYIGITRCEACKAEYFYNKPSTQQLEGYSMLTTIEEYSEYLNYKYPIKHFLCDDCNKLLEMVISILKYYSMDFKVIYNLYNDKKDIFKNYKGIIFDILPYYESSNHFIYGGQFKNDTFENNDRCIIDLDSIIAYIQDYIWELNNNQFNKSNSAIIIPYSSELDAIAYTLAHIKRFDKYNKDIDIDISNRPLTEKIRSAKKFYNGYYLVKSEDCIEYYASFSSDKPFSTRTLDEIIDWFNNNE